ncbi:MAG: DMT family transporter [Cyclobacteriaceae bacterium]|jgi:drug/metabolite transporter (DMT)-like permease|nr:DMT family transporter [Flammeovirgaceae bacterium]MCZ8023280.1 DMT family transporter [Cytophagales bacterium]MCZ8329607.1 DMT family transporter [Cyclobacteriaceae bacterium]
MATTFDYIKLHFIIFLWGFTAVLGLFISIPAIEMVVYRTLLACLAMAILIGIGNETFKLPAGYLQKLLLTGFIVAAHWITFFLSARVANASVSLVGIATGSLWASVLDPLLSKRKVKGYEVVLGLLVLLGLYVIFAFDFSYPLGLALGILSGFLSALFFALNQRLGKRVTPFQVTFYEMLGACIGALLYLAIHVFFIDIQYQINFNATLTDWLCMLVLALVCTVYAFSVSVELMKRLSVFFMQLSLNLEPVYGIVLAVLFFGDTEKMNWQFYIGTLLILAAVAGYPLLKRKFSSDVPLQ